MIRKFDRIRHLDPRSRRFNIRSIMHPMLVPVSREWPCYAILDQGTEGACTGFGTACEAACEPVAVPNINDAIAREVYVRARQLDDFPGEAYDGSTVLGAVKAARERGWYEEFRWAFSVDDLILAVSHQGPAILGVNWYEDMAKPDPSGFIHATGRLLGGHCICAVGWSVERNAMRLQNSWGPSWGENGRCWISRGDLKKLASRGGEACIPVIRGKGVE